MSSSGRGHLRIYLGAAPGVGKTYKMLGEGQRRLTRGTDVVIGFVETHGREHTAAMLDGLEVVPRRIIDYRGASFTEMDLDAVLARRPEVALVDELAHTNVPGSRNEKRWQDIDELLNAGIDVISAVNIQHLESINDVVEKITGVPQQETVPDRVVRAADQIELVDMTPEALRRRMAHGNVYAADKIDAALGNYFRVGNLSALRELALLWLADRVDAGLQQYRAQHDIDSTWEARERVVVALTGGPEGETLIRRAARIAARSSGGDLLAVHVTRSDGLTGADPTRARRAARSGREPRRDLPPGGRRRRPGRTAGLRPRGERDPAGARRQPPVPVVVAAHRPRDRRRRTIRDSGRHRRTHRHALADGPWPVAAVARQPVAPAADLRVRAGRRSAADRWRSLLGSGVTLLNLTSDVLAFLLAVVVVALVGGLWPALLTAVGGSAGPELLLHPADPDLHDRRAEQRARAGDLRLVAALVSSVVDRAARRTRQAARAAAESETLATLAGSVLRGETALPALLERVREAFGMTGACLMERVDDRRTDRDLAADRLGRYADLPAAGGRRRRDPGSRRPRPRAAGAISWRPTSAGWSARSPRTRPRWSTGPA